LSLGEQHLQADITSYTAGCSASQDRIALVGYSMGAWVINKWIMDHPLERDMIRAVVL
jgi:alpha-beta hydrolase superfamily lysophospholipase